MPTAQVNMDPELAVLIFLKNNYSQTNPTGSQVKWTTSPVGEPTEFPQIQVTRRQRTPSMNYRYGGDMIDLCIGTSPIYWIHQRLFVDIYVKPNTSSATSWGQAKQQRWNMLDEVRRILSWNPTGSKDIDYVEIGGTVDYDELQPRPDVLHTRIAITCYDFRTGSG